MGLYILQFIMMMPTVKDKSDQSHISEPAERPQRRVHELLPPGDEQPSESCDPGCQDQDILTRIVIM